MTSIQVLGREIPIEFQIGAEPKRPLDEAGLLAGAQRMADLINSKAWTAEQAAAFRGMNRIVFFEGKVVVDRNVMDRPCCDQDDAVFYWEAEEFERNTDADVRANTFFHDCWHVVQFKRAGNRYAEGDQEPVDREIDAVNEQIKVARTLGNSPEEIAFLERFRDDQEGIRKRLREGVGARIPGLGRT